MMHFQRIVLKGSQAITWRAGMETRAGSAASVLFDGPDLVRFAVEWIERFIQGDTEDRVAESWVTY